MSNTILKIRKRLDLSQEEFASILNVSKQAVQKWESGKNIPDIDHLILLHTKFNVSLDELVFGKQKDVAELRFKPILPDYAARSFWDEFSKNIMFEYRQSFEEGKDILQYKKLIEEIDSLQDSKEKHDLADIVFNLISQAKMRNDYKYVEPSTLNEILPYIRNNHYHKLSYNQNKIKGAITGRIVGCMLGKPVEGVLRDTIMKLLVESNNYPIERYIEKKDVIDGMSISDCYCLDYMIDGPLSDDDIDYTIINQIVIDKYGREFTSINVLDTWLDAMPKNLYCTAERVAYSNYCNGYLPPDTANIKNAYREWIGAQIRADYFGYICPGDPLQAAKLAYKDASISHTKNAIYGEMYFASLLAIVAFEENILNACKLALDYVPCNSRFYEAISNILKDYENGVPEKKAFNKLYNKYDNSDFHDWLHTICNASIVVLSLLYGEKDFDKTMSLAISSGYDTDCNGATAGSVLGMIIGFKNIPLKWLEPIKGMITTDIHYKKTMTIDEFVNKTISHIKEGENEKK